jgi:hypothetical protein
MSDESEKYGKTPLYIKDGTIFRRFRKTTRNFDLSSGDRPAFIPDTSLLCRRSITTLSCFLVNTGYEISTTDLNLRDRES